MNTNLLTIAGRLSDEALLAKVKMLAEGSREVTVELIEPFMVTGPGTSNPPVREMLSESQARLEGRV